MKKLFLPLLLTVLLLSPALPGQAEALPPEFLWQRDPANHWQLDEEGAVISLEAHTLDDAYLCTVCGSEVWLFDDGCADVNNYDEYGNQLRYTSFDAEGVITTDITHALEYNEDGLVMVDREFYDGVLVAVTTYTVNQYGDHVPVTVTVYYDDQTVSVNEHDEFGNVVRSITQDADGHITSETLSEYARGEWGWFYETRNTVIFDDGATFCSEYNEYGDRVRTVNTEADGTVWTDGVYEYEYKSGTMVWAKYYDFGQLIWEQYYDENGVLTEETEYLEDGSRVLYIYTGEGDLISATTMLEDGAVVSVETFEPADAYEEE